jgi:hypothetical protein
MIITIGKRVNYNMSRRSNFKNTMGKLALYFLSFVFIIMGFIFVFYWLMGAFFLLFYMFAGMMLLGFGGFIFFSLYMRR